MFFATVRITLWACVAFQPFGFVATGLIAAHTGCIGLVVAFALIGHGQIFQAASLDLVVSDSPVALVDFLFAIDGCDVPQCTVGCIVLATRTLHAADFGCEERRKLFELLA